jgi:hypothetical protein
MPCSLTDKFLRNIDQTTKHHTLNNDYYENLNSQITIMLDKTHSLHNKQSQAEGRDVKLTTHYLHAFNYIIEYRDSFIYAPDNPTKLQMQRATLFTVK